MGRPGGLCQVNEFRRRLKVFDCPTKLLVMTYMVALNVPIHTL